MSRLRLDGVRVVFDDERAVSDAGVLLVATLARRLDIEALAGRPVELHGDRPGRANAGARSWRRSSTITRPTARRRSPRSRRRAGG
jgi:hypothetical protein